MTDCPHNNQVEQRKGLLGSWFQIFEFMVSWPVQGREAAHLMAAGKQGGKGAGIPIHLQWHAFSDPLGPPPEDPSPPQLY